MEKRQLTDLWRAAIKPDNSSNIYFRVDLVWKILLLRVILTHTPNTTPILPVAHDGPECKRGFIGNDDTIVTVVHPYPTYGSFSYLNCSRAAMSYVVRLPHLIEKCRSPLQKLAAPPFGVRKTLGSVAKLLLPTKVSAVHEFRLHLKRHGFEACRIKTRTWHRLALAVSRPHWRTFRLELLLHCPEMPARRVCRNVILLMHLMSRCA
jgi:hypothetical protein